MPTWITDRRPPLAPTHPLRPIDIALPLVTFRPPRGGQQGIFEEFLGTCFTPCPGVVVTCKHCLPTKEEPGLVLAALVPVSRADQAAGDRHEGWRVKSIENVSAGACDLIVGAIDYDPGVTFGLADFDSVGIGADVSTVGYPFGNVEPVGVHSSRLHIEPRLLKGYVTRAFRNPSHGGFPAHIAFELDMLVPSGTSGAPLIVSNGGPNFIAGVIYGASDTMTLIDEQDEITNLETGERANHKRYRQLSFGNAYTSKDLGELNGPATNGRPLRELMRTP